MRAKSLQSCLTLCDPTDCSPPGSSVHGTSQARKLEWVAMPSSRGSSSPRDQTHGLLHLLHWQVGSLPGKPLINNSSCHKGRAPKNWCFWTVVLEKTLESPLDSKAIKPVNPKGNQFWIPTGKDPDAGKDWRQKRAREDEMVGWHHWFNGHELGQTPGDGKGQGGLACCQVKYDLVTEQQHVKELISIYG